MSQRATCVGCGRRFAEATALPVAMARARFIGRHTVTERTYKPGCPSCYRWDEEAERAVARTASAAIAVAAGSDLPQHSPAHRPRGLRPEVRAALEGGRWVAVSRRGVLLATGATKQEVFDLALDAPGSHARILGPAIGSERPAIAGMWEPGGLAPTIEGAEGVADA